MDKGALAELVESTRKPGSPDWFDDAHKSWFANLPATAV